MTKLAWEEYTPSSPVDAKQITEEEVILKYITYIGDKQQYYGAKFLFGDIDGDGIDEMAYDEDSFCFDYNVERDTVTAHENSLRSGAMYKYVTADGREFCANKKTDNQLDFCRISDGRLLNSAPLFLSVYYKDEQYYAVNSFAAEGLISDNEYISVPEKLHEDISYVDFTDCGFIAKETYHSPSPEVYKLLKNASGWNETADYNGVKLDFPCEALYSDDSVEIYACFGQNGSMLNGIYFYDVKTKTVTADFWTMCEFGDMTVSSFKYDKDSNTFYTYVSYSRNGTEHKGLSVYSLLHKKQQDTAL